jgi:mono/diheme cytochrome c family protein
MRVFPYSTFIFFIVAASPVSAAGDARAGHELATLWCTSCHIVDDSGHGSDAAPPFSNVAGRKGNRWLRAWLAAPHPPMPNFNLSRQQIDDIVAYLGSLPRN